MRENRVYSPIGGSLLTVTMRWTDRLIGVANTIILARLLLLDDFGIIAMATLAIALADVLLGLGVHVAIIQNQKATQAHYDTAWTLRLIQMCVSAVILIAAAPLAADYFNEPRVTLVLQFLALSLVLTGLENIGIVDFQKKMQFGAEFRFLFTRRIVGFAVTIVAAILLRSYWALVIGTISSHLTGTLVSYWMHSMRPRFSLAKFREIFHVSQWMLIYNISTYLQENLHRILVGRWAETTVMGSYSLANQIASMPSSELLAPVNRVLFPFFAKARDDAVRLKRLFLLAQGMQTLIAVPTSVGLALVADEAVMVLLGERWITAIPFIKVLALVNVIYALTTSTRYLLIVVDKTATNALFGWLQVLLFSALAFTLFFESDAIDVALLRLIVAGFGLGLLFWLLIRSVKPLSLRPVELWLSSYRPLLAALIMTGSITMIDQMTPIDLNVWISFAAKVSVGAVSYVVGVLVLWRIAGHPEGAESYVLDKGKEFRANMRLSRGG